MKCNTALSVLLVSAIVVGGCKGNPAAAPPPPPPPPPMTQAQANTFAKHLTDAAMSAMGTCYNRLPVPNSFGTFQINTSCGFTQSCAGGGTIRPSITGTGQMFVNQARVTINNPLSGSQNILDWGCVSNNFIISGNPTVSLNGQISVTDVFSAYLDHSGQIIYGPRGGDGQRTCGVSMRTTENAAGVLRTTGTICGMAIAL